jgi:hypothetical protein
MAPRSRLPTSEYPWDEPIIATLTPPRLQLEDEEEGIEETERVGESVGRGRCG